MALDFLHQARVPRPPQPSSKYAESNHEVQMELQLASQILSTNPKLALQTALDSLDKGVSSNVVGVLTHLQEKDRDGAARLANALIKKLLAEDLTMNQEAANVTFNLLNLANRMEAHGSTSDGKTLVTPNLSPLVDTQSYRDLMELALNAAFKMSTAPNPSDWRERSIAQTLFLGLQSLGSNVEKFAPSRASTLQRKLVEFRRSVDPGTRFWQDNQDVLQTGTVEDILNLAAKATPDLRDQVYQHAAWKASSQGESERARQIISDGITNPMSRRQMLDEFERQAAHKAASEGKLDQARQMLSRLRTNEDRATALTNLAGVLSSKGDKETAIRLLEEARLLVGNKAANWTQIQAQLQLARAFGPIDAAKSLEILETMIAQLNGLLDAAETLDGFEHHYYKDGELLWQGSNLSNQISQLIDELGRLATVDFDRAKDLAQRFQRPEVRLMAQLSVARAVLSERAQANQPVYGRRTMTSLM